MCGIAGVVNYNNVSNLDIRSLEKISNAILHRGPDDEQYYQDEKVAFAFRRLSIIDLQSGGQPFYNEDRTICVMVNGEIYNHLELKKMLKHKHLFKSDSDCEVIVHIYEEMGIDFLNHLIGMYSISIYDSKIDKLILARDRFGIKPLFYNFGEDYFIFCSEIKGLLQYHKCPREFDLKTALQDPWMIANPMTNLKQPSSFFKGIEHLPAASYLILDLKTRDIKVDKYWNITDIQPSSLNSEQLIDEYIYLLEDSVKNCLMSDVGVGIFLSGGIDSIAVANYASKYKDIASFSVLSPSTFSNGDAKYSNLAAKHLGIKNYQVLYTEDNINYSSEDWKKLLWLCENPMTGPEQLYKYHLHKFSKAMYPNLKVMLTGQGSDEFNGGYSKLYTETNNWDEFLDSLSSLERGRILHNVTGTLSKWDQVFGVSPFKKDFYYGVADEETNSNDYLNYVFTKYRDIQMYNCWHEDRTASGNHIENRVPFLDHRLVELSLSAPKHMYKQLFMDKQILRSGLSKTSLPASLIRRPKVPFYYGEEVRTTHKTMMNILTQNNYSLIEEAFTSISHLFDIDSVINIAKKINNDYEYENIEFLTRLVNMGLLNTMAQNLDTEVKTVSEIALHPSVEIDNWNLTKSERNNLFHIKSEEFNLDLIPKINENVKILKSLTDSDESLYISIENELTYLVEKIENEDWYNFLLCIDNESSLEELLRKNNIIYTNINQIFEEALQSNVILI